MTIYLTEDVHKRLTLYKLNNKYKSLGAALEHLLNIADYDNFEVIENIKTTQEGLKQVVVKQAHIDTFMRWREKHSYIQGTTAVHNLIKPLLAKD